MNFLTSKVVVVVVCVFLVGAGSTSPLQADNGVIELDKAEALAIMNLAFLARAAAADAEEASRNFQVALAKIFKDNDVTAKTHVLNLLTGTLDMITIEESDEITP